MTIRANLHSAPILQDTSVRQTRRADIPMMELDELPRHRRGLEERFKSLTSRNKALKEHLQSWRGDVIGAARAKNLSDETVAALEKKLEQVTNQIRCAKRVSSKEVDLSRSDLTSLPDISELRMLKCLNLLGNALEQVPDIGQMPPRLNRIEVLENPLNTLPESFGRLPESFGPDMQRVSVEDMRRDGVVFDEKNSRLTIPLRTPPNETGKTISLEFLMYRSGSHAEKLLLEVKKNYSLMTSLSWSDKEANRLSLSGNPSDHRLEARANDISESGLTTQNQSTDAPMIRNRNAPLTDESFWDRVSESSDEFAYGAYDSYGSEGGKKNYRTQMSNGHLDGSNPYANQNLLSIRKSLRDFTGHDDVEFSLNAILVNPAR